MNTLTLEKHCWAEIDLTALRENYEYIRRTVGGPVCAVVKADAYGHGDNVIARVLQEAGAAGFAVSSLGEGRHLRRGGITTPILILGYADPTYAAVLAANDLITTCYSTEYAQALSAATVKAGVKVKVHLKIDTGMGRIGFAVRSGFAETIRELEALYALPGLDICGVFQHFAVADSVEPALHRRAARAVRAGRGATACGRLPCRHGTLRQLCRTAAPPRVAARHDPRGHHPVRA